MKLELPVFNVWHIGDSKQEFEIKNNLIVESYLTCLLRLVAKKLVIIALRKKESLSPSDNAL